LHVFFFKHFLFAWIFFLSPPITFLMVRPLPWDITKIYHPLTILYHFIIAFIVWSNDEVEYFVSKLSRQVFHCDITLTAIGICVGIATRHCNKVCLWIIIVSVKSSQSSFKHGARHLHNFIKVLSYIYGSSLHECRAYRIWYFKNCRNSFRDSACLIYCLVMSSSTKNCSTKRYFLRYGMYFRLILDRLRRFMALEMV
jgi:hypothetical protein